MTILWHRSAEEKLLSKHKNCWSKDERQPGFGHSFVSDFYLQILINSRFPQGRVAVGAQAQELIIVRTKDQKKVFQRATEAGAAVRGMWNRSWSI